MGIYKRRQPVRNALVAAGLVQGVAGTFLSGGCFCDPEQRLLGLALAFGMGAVVVAFVVFGFLSQMRPRLSVVICALVEVGLLRAMAHPAILASTSGWIAQVPVLILLVVAVVAAFARPPRDFRQFRTRP
jgi:hypothetical protein